MPEKITSKNLMHNAIWLVKLRWIAITCLFFSILFAIWVLDLNVNVQYLLITVFCMIGLNIIYHLILGYLSEIEEAVEKPNFGRGFLNFQISIDFIILTFVLNNSGGIENPFIVFYVLHIVIGSILLPRKDSLMQTTFVVLLFISLVFLETIGVLPHYSLNSHISELISTDKAYLLAAILIFIATSYLVVYVTSTISKKLHDQQKALAAANRELLKKDQIKNEYVLRVSHDIKNHLAAIKSNLEILNQRLFGEISTEYNKYIKNSYSRTSKLIDFVNDLLHLTRMKLKDHFEKDEFHLEELIKRTYKSYKYQAESKHIEVTIIVEEEVELFYGNSFVLGGALANLIQNSVNYTPEQGTIKISAGKEDDQLILVIKDSGIGIPKEDIKHIFGEFYRGSNVKSIVGSGLGLSFVRQVAENHGGTVSIDSELGKGTIIQMILPVIEKESREKSA